MRHTTRIHACLSGTPAEAGVRGVSRSTWMCYNHVSVEPLPKQGCEQSSRNPLSRRIAVSVEPLPKQGCEMLIKHRRLPRNGLSGTPAEAGVRDVNWTLDGYSGLSQWNPCRSRGASWWPMLSLIVAKCLSGTPAEAGVRVSITRTFICGPWVSVEPLPKQGCEWFRFLWTNWFGPVSVEPLPKQGCEKKFIVIYTIEDKRLSGTPAEAGVRASSSCWMSCRHASLSGTPAEAGVRGPPCTIRLVS